MIWSKLDQADSSYQNPSVFGRLTFFRIGETDVEVVASEPTGPPREPEPADAPDRQADAPVADRVEDLLARMTLPARSAR